MNYKVVNWITEEEKQFLHLKEVFEYLDCEIKRLNCDTYGGGWGIADFAIFEFYAPGWEWRKIY